MASNTNIASKEDATPKVTADPDPKQNPDPTVDPVPGVDLDTDPDLSVGAAELLEMERSCRRQLSSAGLWPAEWRARLHNRLGLLLYGQVRFDEAAEEYSAALEAWPRLAAAAHNRAIVRYRMGYFQEAERDLMLAQSLEPENTEIATGLQETRRLLRAVPAEGASS
ncbi:Tetratricopeptide repeat protein 32 [Amphibalanus amphitrite]|uniref:Tetratricopeptide repeat protein 32 n=1 Tax=Amphibalanus amphitrite TaxID=1232801 RepID=A0A6A4WZ07_AMPAM|nr:Tetratricopeptide repeat protein 32 [Amphibalanus amphitrite]